MDRQADSALGRLPELEPPADSWRRISRAALRESWIASWRRLRPVALAGGLTATAGALAVTILATAWQKPAAPSQELLLVQGPDRELVQLQTQSEALESLLRSLPRGPQLVRADHVAATTTLEDRIAQVDSALNRSHVRQPAAAADAPALWRERVDLMGELVRARYTEAGLAAY